jgi:hypothetical protein
VFEKINILAMEKLDEMAKSNAQDAVYSVLVRVSNTLI